MARAGTKSAEIMRLYEQGLSTREIAEKVGCSDAYVRVVARQRKGGGRSEIDKRYNYSDRGQEAQDRRNAKRRAAYHSVPRDVRKEVRRRAYENARANGAPTSRARNAGFDAIMRVALTEEAHA